MKTVIRILIIMIFLIDVYTYHQNQKLIKVLKYNTDINNSLSKQINEQINEQINLKTFNKYTDCIINTSNCCCIYINFYILNIFIC